MFELLTVSSFSKLIMSTQTILNEALFGPLQLTGEFSYIISKTCEIDNELLEYIKSIDEETEKQTKIISLIEDSVFTRTIKLDLGHTKPLIGLITMKIFNQSYNITHISVHKSFRRQGLAKMLLSTLANFINESEPKYELVSVVVSENEPNTPNDIITLFRSLKFNEMIIEDDHHMLKHTQFFTKIIDCPV
jgi:predicted GNAT family acetyltransferase